MISRAGATAVCLSLLFASCTPPPIWKDETAPHPRTSNTGLGEPGPRAYGLAIWPVWGIGAGEVSTGIGLSSLSLGAAGLVLPGLAGGTDARTAAPEQPPPRTPERRPVSKPTEGEARP